MCRSLNREHGIDYLSLMPTNLYGPGDNFDLTSSHVLPAMIRKFHEAKVALDAGAAAPDASLALWGTGRPRREFLYVEAVCRGFAFCLQHVHTTARLSGQPLLCVDEDFAQTDLELVPVGG
jgi:GDP-L-fucose synthase